MKMLALVCFALFSMAAFGQANQQLSNISNVALSADLAWPSSGTNATHYLKAGAGDNIQLLGVQDSSGFGGGVTVRADGGILLDATSAGAWEASTATGSGNDMNINPDWNLVVGAGSGGNVVLGKRLQLQGAAGTCSSGLEGSMTYVPAVSGVSDGYFEGCKCLKDGSCAWHQISTP